MNNLAPLRKEENPLIGLMERGEKPGAGGPAQPPSALDAKRRHSPKCKTTRRPRLLYLPRGSPATQSCAAAEQLPRRGESGPAARAASGAGHGGR